MRRPKLKPPAVATYETEDGRVLPTVPPKPKRVLGTHVVQAYVPQPYVGDGGYMWTCMSAATDEITARRWAKETWSDGRKWRVVTVRELRAERKRRDKK